MNQGQCLCGSVKVSTEKAINELHVCHCGMCLKWNGGPGFMVDCESDIEINGQDFVSSFDSSEWGKRAFCKKCGTHLFYHFLPASTYYVSSTLFETDKGAKIDSQIFIDNKPHYYNFSEKSSMYTEEEVMKLMLS